MAKGLTVKVKGVNATLKEIRRLAKVYPQSALRALYRQGELVMTDSKRTYVPVDQGPLRASGHVVAEKMTVTLGFGGPAGIGNQGGESNEDRVGYAIVQHEVLTYDHTVGGAEYLKKPLLAALPRMGPEMAADVKRDVGA